MLATLEWKSLQDRRKDARLGMLYKIVNDKVTLDKGDRLVPPLRSTRNIRSKFHLTVATTGNSPISLEQSGTGTLYLRILCQPKHLMPSRLKYPDFHINCI